MFSIRKFTFIFIGFFIVFILVACGGNNHAGDTNKDVSENGTEQNTSDNENSQKENKDKEEPKLEIVNSTGGVWKNSIGTVWIHSGAVFENTGTVPVKIGETQMNFKAQDGSILGTATMVYSVPRIVAPGEQAYIGESTILEGVTELGDYKETTYNFSFDVTDEEANLLEVTGVKGIPGDNEYSSPYRVTGVVVNTTDQLQNDIRISAALFAEDGSLLGVLEGGVDVGVNPGSEAGFELSYPEISRDVVNQVKTVEVKAYAWNWNW